MSSTQHTACSILKTGPGKIFALLGRIMDHVSHPSRWFSGFTKVPFGGICDGSLGGITVYFPLYEHGISTAHQIYIPAQVSLNWAAKNAPAKWHFFWRRKQLPKTGILNIWVYLILVCVSKCVKLHVITDCFPCIQSVKWSIFWCALHHWIEILTSTSKQACSMAPLLLVFFGLKCQSFLQLRSVSVPATWTPRSTLPEKKPASQWIDCSWARRCWLWPWHKMRPRQMAPWWVKVSKWEVCQDQWAFCTSVTLIAFIVLLEICQMQLLVQTKAP